MGNTGYMEKKKNAKGLFNEKNKKRKERERKEKKI